MGNIRHSSDCYYRCSVSPTSGEYLGEIYLIATVGLVDGACTDVSQEFHEVSRFDKREKLRDLLSECSPKEKILVFVKTKKTADFIATHLSGEGFPATSIHCLVAAATFAAAAHEQFDDRPRACDGDVAGALALSGRG